MNKQAVVTTFKTSLIAIVAYTAITFLAGVMIGVFAAFVN